MMLSGWTLGKRSTFLCVSQLAGRWCMGRSGLCKDYVLLELQSPQAQQVSQPVLQTPHRHWLISRNSQARIRTSSIIWLVDHFHLLDPSGGAATECCNCSSWFIRFFWLELEYSSLCLNQSNPANKSINFGLPNSNREIQLDRRYTKVDISQSPAFLFCWPFSEKYTEISTTTAKTRSQIKIKE